MSQRHKNDLRHDCFSNENETDFAFLTSLYYDYFKEMFYISDSSEVIWNPSTFYLPVLTVDTPRMFPYSVCIKRLFVIAKIKVSSFY